MGLSTGMLKNLVKSIKVDLMLVGILNRLLSINYIDLQIEVTEEYNGVKSVNASVSEDETLDMQKGDKANVLRKLSESGKIINF